MAMLTSSRIPVGKIAAFQKAYSKATPKSTAKGVKPLTMIRSIKKFK